MIFLQRAHFLLLALLSFTSLYADSHEDRFTQIYDRKLWGVNEHGEGFSGGGSLLKKAKPYYDYLTFFLKEYNIKSVVDLGCGDWELSRHVDWSGIDYHGYDVVASRIERNSQRYGSDTIHFHHANFLEEEIPPADLMICKHVLQHLPNRDVWKAIKMLSKFKHCLIMDGAPLVPGVNLESQIRNEFPYWDDRGLDLTAPPFNIVGEKVLQYRNVGIDVLLHIDNTLKIVDTIE